jgi:DNA polymerase III subunit alpha
LPNFPIPNEFKTHTQQEKVDEKTILTPDMLNQWEYLKDITFKGAKIRYTDITPEVEDRLNFELLVIRRMGFAGYFLIVSDFIKAGKDLGVIVGPGRGSAAGSAVAYCIGITSIDPIKYDLLFERFLNPERKSMPDIDTDFDDEGRQKVIDYVVDKYGKEKVAQIVTYGKMAAKMSVKDVARVMDFSMEESNHLTKLFPSKPIGINLKQILHDKIEGAEEVIEEENIDGDSDHAEAENKDVVVIRKEEVPGVMKLREYYHDAKSPYGDVLRQAELLEGSVRNTGVHAAGIIIAPKDLKEILPVAISRDSDLYLTQYDGKVVEDAGVIKMDFLGLKTLSILKTAVEIIKMNHGVTIDMDNIPLR